MIWLIKFTRLLAVSSLCLTLAATAQAQTLIRPQSDDQLLEVLPAANRDRSLRQSTAPPGDRAAAQTELIALAARQLQAARVTGDPRMIGRAQTLLSNTDMRDHPDAMLLRAQGLQARHEFDAALAELDRLLVMEPGHRGALLQVANIERVRGRLASAEQACRRALAIQPDSTSRICLADLIDLQGDAVAGQKILRSEATSTEPVTQNWAWRNVTLAEIAARNGNSEQAEKFYRRALLAADDYVIKSYSDWLMAQGQSRRAIKLIEGLRGPETASLSDSLLVTLAIAYRVTGNHDRAGHLQTVAGQRFADLDHAGIAPNLRARARFALDLEQAPGRALQLAAENWRDQRESADALLLARAALASKDEAVLRSLRNFVSETGFSDDRLDSLLKEGAGS